MEEDTEQSDIEIETIHIQSDNCDCRECQKARNKYVAILDVDRYIESLNDWD